MHLFFVCNRDNLINFRLLKIINESGIKKYKDEKDYEGDEVDFGIEVEEG